MRPELINTAKAADVLGVRPQTLRLWRSRGTGPTYVRLHGTRGRVLYDVADLRAWLDTRRFTSTAEEAEGERA